jgi:hypothetical protein
MTDRMTFRTFPTAFIEAMTASDAGKVDVQHLCKPARRGEQSAFADGHLPTDM